MLSKGIAWMISYPLSPFNLFFLFFSIFSLRLLFKGLSKIEVSNFDFFLKWIDNSFCFSKLGLAKLVSRLALLNSYIKDLLFITKLVLNLCSDKEDFDFLICTHF